MADTKFWTDGVIEPKRQNRWVVQFDGIYNGGNMYFATKVQRPVIEVTKKEHKYLNHIFNYPGRVVWKPITLTMVDPAGSKGTGTAFGNHSVTDAAVSLMEILVNSGYVVPATATSLDTVSKRGAVGSLSGGGAGATANGVTITMVDHNGVHVEKWTLKNAFVTRISPSELSYDDDNIATLEIEVTYDYCEFNADTPGKTVKFKAE